jgi:hypothetical protein
MLAESGAGPLRVILAQPADGDLTSWKALQSGKSVPLGGGGRTQLGVVSVFATSGDASSDAGGNLLTNVLFDENDDTGELLMRILCRRVDVGVDLIAVPVFIEIKFNHSIGI